MTSTNVNYWTSIDKTVLKSAFWINDLKDVTKLALFEDVGDNAFFFFHRTEVQYPMFEKNIVK